MSYDLGGLGLSCLGLSGRGLGESWDLGDLIWPQWRPDTLRPKSSVSAPITFPPVGPGGVALGCRRVNGKI